MYPDKNNDQNKTNLPLSPPTIFKVFLIAEIFLSLWIWNFQLSVCFSFFFFFLLFWKKLSVIAWVAYFVFWVCWRWGEKSILWILTTAKPKGSKIFSLWKGRTLKLSKRQKAKQKNRYKVFILTKTIKS